MLEVRPGLLLGSMGDALAVFTRVPSVVARYHVTHVLSLCNEPPEWMNDEEDEATMVGETSSGGEAGKELEAEEDEEKSGGDGTVEGGGECTDIMEEEETEAGQRRQNRRRSRRRRRGRGQVELPKWRKFIAVADMAKSDLLFHFEQCCRFVRDGRERGTILVHCEHGVSRSVTVVLAYLMWSERLPLKLLYQELKERRPEIRPNPGFMDQLRLWEEMGCQLKEENKRYRAYCLQRKAAEMEVTGSIEGVRMGPDPAACPVDSAAYFRCRKCRQLLFTDHEVLQHELGEGRRAFSKHRGRKGGRGNQSGDQNTTAASRNQSTEAEGEAMSVTEGERETQEVGPGKVGMAEMLELEREKEEDDEEVVLGGNSEFPVASLAGISWGHTPSLVSELPVRGEVGSELTQQKHGSLSVSSPCTSYFIEPVAWMGDSLLGHLEGKILCPKCNSRLGSFSWKGQQCSCGRWLTPAFQVHRSKVDEIKTLSRRKNI